jgi:hypothetical protein
MADRIPARLTAAEGRRFGLSVGGAFIAIATVSRWRGHGEAALVLGSLGSALALAGLTLPTYLGPVERAWMGLAHAISRVTTPIVMGVMYFVVITPTAAIRRAFGGNPLVHADEAAGFWKQRPPDGRQSKSMERQF